MSVTEPCRACNGTGITVLGMNAEEAFNLALAVGAYSTAMQVDSVIRYTTDNMYTFYSMRVRIVPYGSFTVNSRKDLNDLMDKYHLRLDQ